MRYYAIIILGILFAQPAGAQDDQYEESTHHVVDPAVVSQRNGYDSQPIRAKKFDPQKWKDVIGNERYSEAPRSLKYRKTIHDSTDSETSKGEMRFKTQDQDQADDSEFFQMPPMDSQLLKIIVYTLAVGLIVFILYALLKNIGLKASGKIEGSASPDASGPVEDIRELEIDRLLREAVSAGDYRLAIRIYFLGLLKKLDENGSIIWKKNKTNFEYLTELYQRTNYFHEVKNLTMAYEKVWYGDHALSAQSYQQIIASFKAVDKKINTSNDR
jgi:hypothetical protein